MPEFSELTKKAGSSQHNPAHWLWAKGRENEENHLFSGLQDFEPITKS